MLKIELIPLDDVIIYDKERYNSNNYKDPENGYKAPSDYASKAEGGNTKRWISSFRNEYKIITLEAKDMEWMRKASLVGSISGSFPRSFDEELEDTLLRYSHLSQWLFSKNERYFVRGEQYSLKTGTHGAGPYTSLSQILESLISGSSGHSELEHFFKKEDSQLILYLVPWMDKDVFIKDLEFRVFVYENTITAISQQHLYSRNDTIEEENIPRYVSIIKKYFEEKIRPVLTHTSSYCIDFALLKGEIPYFIELNNSFGREYSAGSALFHWHIDYDLLTDKSCVTFRYTR